MSFLRAYPPGTYVSVPDHHDHQTHRYRERALSHVDRPDYLLQGYLTRTH